MEDGKLYGKENRKRTPMMSVQQSGRTSVCILWQDNNQRTNERTQVTYLQHLNRFPQQSQ